MRENCITGSSPLDTAQDHLLYPVRTLSFPLPSSSRPSPSPASESHYPYDAWVLAGGRLFRAHAHVLAAHSPYLRASINALGEARLLLPHVPPTGFGAILSYMYTGRLSLTQAPLYETLLTGHLLQMPGIVALCQTLLASSPLLNGSSSSPLFASGASDSRGIPGFSQPDRILPQALTTWQNLARLMPATDTTPKVQPTLIRPTPTRPFRNQTHDNTHAAEEPETSSQATPPRLLHMGQQYTFCQSLKGSVFSPSSEIAQRGSAEDEEEIRSNSSSVVLDVAACDGPVFFERVINKAFKSPHSNNELENGSDSDDSEIDVVDTGITESPFLRGFLTSFKNQVHPPTPNPGGGSRIYHCVYCNSNFKSHYCYQKHMRRHINPITVEETESVSVDDASRGATTSSAFVKSGTTQQAAAAAAISTTKLPAPPQSPSVEGPPVTGGDEALGALSPSSSTTKGDQSRAESVSSGGGEESHSNATTGSRKLRVLDLNVQYFPCKTCGSKFPSYYFVHKHRRMCHRDEEEATGGGRERRKSQTPTTPTSSDCDSLAFTAPPNPAVGGEFQQAPSDGSCEEKL